MIILSNTIVSCAFFFCISLSCFFYRCVSLLLSCCSIEILPECIMSLQAILNRCTLFGAKAPTRPPSCSWICAVGITGAMLSHMSSRDGTLQPAILCMLAASVVLSVPESVLSTDGIGVCLRCGENAEKARLWHSHTEDIVQQPVVLVCTAGASESFPGG